MDVIDIKQYLLDSEIVEEFIKNKEFGNIHHDVLIELFLDLEKLKHSFEHIIQYFHFNII